MDHPIILSARRKILAIAKQVEEGLKDYDVPAEKMDSMADFGINLLMSSPNIKVSRIVRKTIEHFHLKKRSDVTS